jgi:hypothetical protein
VPGRDRRRLRRLVCILVFAPALLAVSGPAAFATFSGAASVGQGTVSTATLQAPSAPATAAGSCTPGVGATIVVSWTPTSSTWADGYEVLRSLTSSGPFVAVGTASGQSTSSYANSGLLPSTAYYYVVKATKGGWRSAASAQVSRTTPTALCT